MEAIVKPELEIVQLPGEMDVETGVGQSEAIATLGTKMVHMTSAEAKAIFLILSSFIILCWLVVWVGSSANF